MNEWASAVFFVGVGAFCAGTALAARVVVTLVLGVVLLVGGLVLGLTAAPAGEGWLLIVFGLVVFAISYRLGRRPSWRRSMRGTGKGAGGGGWVLSGSRRSTSGAGRPATGGTTPGPGGFGGGRSGGGGASGRW